MPFSLELELAHLRRRLLEVHDLGRLLEDVRLGHREHRTEAGVHPLGEVARDLQVLALVLADRDERGVVHEDVGGHEHRVGEQPDVGVVPLGGLVLELRHAAHLAHRRLAGQDPRELGVLANVALAEHRRGLGVDTARDELGRRHPGAAPQHLGVGGHGQRVQVGHEVVGVEVLLQPDPVDQRPQVVAEVQGVARRLHPREDARACGIGRSRRGHGLIVSGGAVLDSPA
jgi:hypothetical protein